MKYTHKKMCIGRLVLLFSLCVIKEASKVEHSASYVVGWLLVVAAGGSLCFGCPHPAPRRIRSQGHHFRIAVNKFEAYMQKERDSKPSVDEKPDIGKWPGVGPTNENLRFTPNRCSFRSLASKDFPDGYSTGGCVCACVCSHTQKLRTYEVVFGNDARRAPPTPPPCRWPTLITFCLLYTSPSPRDKRQSRMPSSA